MALLLSYIRTLRRLAIASACANLLQVVGISIIVEYLIRDMPKEPQIENFRPISEVALGFGSAMFAFEGISVVLPIYTRMKRQEQMGGLFGIINLSYAILLALYFLVGLFGYLRFGSSAAGSITLNLPFTPLYDVVRAIFVVALSLTYPLQFYVPYEIIWNAISDRLMLNDAKSLNSRQRLIYDYLCRTVLVAVTFIIAMEVPKLNLMMEFFGSISGTALSITLPPLIHLAAFWEDTSGLSRWLMAALDGLIVAFGLVASANGSYFSFMEILKSFDGHNATIAH